ncbi:aminotransferase class I/II-fold pyridoxal phosphate-dependent enzyme [Kineosporia sp. NBRC 101731]|uniref:MalY/PatB family protein n=1 Tax=Kineosporia sp. NBRC 101731 TaxID=3032199 RepID=UPI0024A0881C|nr:aminotransferase class I/II-fold pyridoxal phosphate-dependent enzyme [Kineosporia sp. NBRC 101731]GLY28973.1 cystathionine beta-lyase [Kineosporia sp. NBRC 101731]
MNTADPLDELRRRTSEKWTTYGDDVLPMFVAEMDFPLAPPIADALVAAVSRGDTGYVNPHDRSASRAFASYAQDAWGWLPSVKRMSPTTDVSVVVVESLRRLIVPGQGVVIMPPVYPPFYDLVSEAGGSVVEVAMLEDGMDLEAVDRALAAGAGGVLLCNPHNPTGLVHSFEQLAELSQIVARHNGFVVSDEIHAPLTHHGQQFTPYLAVSDEAREHGVAAVSGSKAFNLAGLKCAFFVVESDRMDYLLRSLPEEVTARTGLFGLIATREGFTHCRGWLDDTITAVESNFDVLDQELAAHLPSVTVRRARASYLAWLDMSALGWGADPSRTVFREGRVALTRGTDFGPQGAGFARMNLACAPGTIVEAVSRIAALVP